MFAAIDGPDGQNGLDGRCRETPCHDARGKELLLSGIAPSGFFTTCRFFRVLSAQIDEMNGKSLVNGNKISAWKEERTARVDLRGRGRLL